MNKEIYLISEQFVRTMGSISNNVESKFVLPVIRETQDIDFQTVVGECLYNKLKELVANDEIGDMENAVYKDLLDIAQYQLLYGCLERLCLVTSAKISNAGAYQNQENGMRAFTLKEVFQLQDQYRIRKDFYTRRLQEFLLENEKALKEIDSCVCDKIRANLRSAASTSIWLGGERGRYRINKTNQLYYK